MDLHNLNIRLTEHKNFLWNCTTCNDPDDLYEEVASTRMASGITQNCALVMSEDLWLRWISVPQVSARFRSNHRKEFLDRGVMGVWFAAHELDEVVVLCDFNVHKDDRTICDMSYTFVHVSQIKYPRQFDAPKRVA